MPESPDLSADCSDRGDDSADISADIFVSTASGCVSRNMELSSILFYTIIFDLYVIKLNISPDSN
jgi:hypothetical protein